MIGLVGLHFYDNVNLIPSRFQQCSPGLIWSVVVMRIFVGGRAVAAQEDARVGLGPGSARSLTGAVLPLWLC